MLQFWLTTSSQLQKEAEISFSDKEVDTADPFVSDTTALEIRNGRAMILYGRHIKSAPVPNSLSGYHQGSQVVLVNSETMQPIDIDYSEYRHWVSHSFQQDIYYQDDTFYLAERGDAYPRGFAITTIQNDKAINVQELFMFKGETGENDTYSLLGNLVSLGDEICLVGSYENLNLEYPKSPRNLFIQKLSDTSPTYLTDYTDGEVAEVGAIKSVALPDGIVSILYEECSKEINGHFDRKSVHLLTIDKNGNKISHTEIPREQTSYIPIGNPVYYNQSLNAYQWVTYTGYHIYLNTIKKGIKPERKIDERDTEIANEEETGLSKVEKIATSGTIEHP